MSIYVPIEDLRRAVNLDELTTSAYDNDLKTYSYAAQAAAEGYCKRIFNASVSSPEYFDGSSAVDRLILKAFPIVSVESLYDDPSYAYDAAHLISSADYVRIDERGEVFLRNSKFYNGKRNVKINYHGGFLPELTVVTAALATDLMTVANSLSAYSGQAFSLFVKTSTAQTAGSVTIVGKDLDGNAQTEVIAFTGTTAQRKVSANDWSLVTSFSALPIQGATGTGTVTVTATSFPQELRVAIALHVSHLFFQKRDQDINITSRSEESTSEGGITKDVPKEVSSILDGFRQYL